MNFGRAKQFKALDIMSQGRAGWNGIISVAAIYDYEATTLREHIGAPEQYGIEPRV